MHLFKSRISGIARSAARPTLLAILLAGVAVAPSTPIAAEERAIKEPILVTSYEAAPVAVVMDDEAPKQLPKTQMKPVVIDNTPRVGSRSPEVLMIEQRLEALNYLVGKVDGVFDKATQHGVFAFQKVEGLARNGKGDTATLERLKTASTPTPRFTTPADHLEVDIPRQVVLVVRGGKVAWIVHTSTGSGKMFTNQGYTRRAITPNGRFKVTRKINAMRISPLGELYKPSYFNGGIAFHGNGSVPVYPASHGCVRLPMQFADWFFVTAAPIGQMVYVYGGPDGPNPQPYIDDKPAPSPSPSPSPTPELESTTPSDPTNPTPPSPPTSTSS